MRLDGNAHPDRHEDYYLLNRRLMTEANWSMICDNNKEDKIYGLACDI